MDAWLLLLLLIEYKAELLLLAREMPVSLESPDGRRMTDEAGGAGLAEEGLRFRKPM